MRDFPDFTKISLADAASLHGASSEYRKQYITVEAIDIQSMAMPQDAPMAELAGQQPGIAPYLRGVYPTMYDTPLDNSSICRFFNSQGIKRLLSTEPSGWPDGAVGCVRFANASWV